MCFRKGELIMGYKEKMAEGLDAKGNFTFKQIDGVVRRIAEAMGEKAILVKASNEAKGGILIYLFATSLMEIVPALKLSKEPYITAVVSISPDGAGDSRTIVSVEIANAYTTQMKTMGIPSGPKKIHGLSKYREFCDLFDAELHSEDPTANIKKR
jgi:hypothetical protein